MKFQPGSKKIQTWRFAARIGAIRADRLARMHSQQNPIFIPFERFARMASNLRFAMNSAPSVIIQCGCWEELCSPYTRAKLQPNTGQNLASMGPGILSSSGVGVWRKAPEAYPDSNTTLDKFQSSRIGPSQELVKPAKEHGCLRLGLMDICTKMPGSKASSALP